MPTKKKSLKIDEFWSNKFIKNEENKKDSLWTKNTKNLKQHNASRKNGNEKLIYVFLFVCLD